MIVNAFASADKKTLKDLTSPEVYKSFVAVLDDRKNKKLLMRHDVLFENH